MRTSENWIGSVKSIDQITYQLVYNEVTKPNVTNQSQVVYLANIVPTLPNHNGNFRRRLLKIYSRKYPYLSTYHIR